ncbi:ABC transporter ATP-binding protein [Tissierella creatinophila]|uniref:Putative HMP/thiamine import ATP-binding protein YkoD n=1 Tax=Tissierella creatinophila DSM 6911 TaxID=1123403 RepID=A0A1U7M4S8_TISCR|nr:ABC transporter ATP-binding protein [Tissierella creatinophila]OLS02322.1 putative HMP/thiamine import ATP-binding protein YkoD [Tissierella creatinophila DSM 6911]
MAFIDIKNLSFTYPNEDKKVLDNISLKIDEGEFIVVCGSTGCGKSTLLKQLKVDLSPHGVKTGDIFYKNTSIDSLDKRTAASEIGYVLQNPEAQIVTDKVWHELAFGLENLGVPSSVIRLKVAEIASFFGIEEWFRQKTADLSGGQKQLLNLASIMVMNPKLLILDEPTSQLDPIAAADFISTLAKLNKELSLTILLVEHRLEEVFTHADKVAVLDEGKLIAFDKPRNISKFIKNHPVLYSMPTPVRVYNKFSTDDDCPLTIREGRSWLLKNFPNKKNLSISIESKTLEEDNPVLEMKDIYFRYDKTLPDVLTGTSLKVYRGEIFCILGGNGSGKTTALTLLSRINKPYRGKVILNGKNIDKYKSKELYHNNIALLPQDPQTTFVTDSVEKEFKEIIKTMNYSKLEAEVKVDKIIDRLNIKTIIKKHPYDLSGGEQQKVALAKILLLEPEIILLDEPTKGIDAYSKIELANILKELKDEGKTILMVSHDIEFAAEYSDRCALFFDGEVVSVGDPYSFFNGNNFYTTAANKMSRNIFKNAITSEDVIELCKKIQIENTN